MAAAFSIDTLEMKVQVLAKAATIIKKNDEQEQIVEAALAVINQAIAQDKYETADRLGRLALSAAHKAKDAALVKRAKTRIKEIAEAAKAFEEVETAMKTLDEKPLDPEANLAVGKYLCFKKGDWKQGRSMLALGGDATLKALALKEIERPADAAEQARLGDGWWDLAEKEAGAAQKNLQVRACHWYKKALPELSGLAKDKVEKRVAEVEKDDAEAGPDSDAHPQRPAQALPVKPQNNLKIVVDDVQVFNEKVASLFPSSQNKAGEGMLEASSKEHTWGPKTYSRAPERAPAAPWVIEEFPLFNLGHAAHGAIILLFSRAEAVSAKEQTAGHCDRLVNGGRATPILGMGFQTVAVIDLAGLRQSRELQSR